MLLLLVHPNLWLWPLPRQTLAPNSFPWAVAPAAELFLYSAMIAGTQVHW